MRSYLGNSLVAPVAKAGDPPPSTPPSKLEWTPVTGIDHQIFPSATISTATRKNPDHPFVYLHIKMSNVPSGAKVHVSVKCDSLMDASSADVATTKDEAALDVPIKPSWKFDQLAHVRQQIPMNFIYSLTIDGKEVGEKTDTVTVHSVNDCILAIRNDTGGWDRTPLLFAAYVNEDHPKIDQLLKEALATGIVKQFDGYQKNDPKDVWLQVFAVWDALQLRGIKYSDITEIPDKSDVIHAQHVRFLDESVDNAQANCVDGSVIFASVLRKIGINCGLVIRPPQSGKGGHMYIVFFTEPDRKGWVALETTMMGAVDLKGDPRNYSLNLLDPKWKTRASALSLDAAVKKGQEEFTEFLAADKGQKEKNTNDYIGCTINIAEARKNGIMPVPYVFTKKP